MHRYRHTGTSHNTHADMCMFTGTISPLALTCTATGPASGFYSRIGGSSTTRDLGEEEGGRDVCVCAGVEECVRVAW